MVGYTLLLAAETVISHCGDPCVHILLFLPCLRRGPVLGRLLGVRVRLLCQSGPTGVPSWGPHGSVSHDWGPAETTVGVYVHQRLSDFTAKGLLLRTEE